MRLALFLLLAALAAPLGAADLVATLDGVIVTLHETPCGDKVKALLKPEYREQFQSGSAVFPDRTLELCWAIHPQSGQIVIVDEEGDTGAIPPLMFAPKPGI